MEEFYILPCQKLYSVQKIRKTVNRGQNHLNLHIAICRQNTGTGYFKLFFLVFPSAKKKKKNQLFIMLHCLKYTHQNLWRLYVQCISVTICKFMQLFYLVCLSIYNISTPHPHKTFTFYLEIPFFLIMFSLMVFA